MLKNKDFYFLRDELHSSNQIFIQNFNQLFSEIKDTEFSFFGQIGIKKLFNDLFYLRQRYNRYLINHSEIKNIKINNPIFVSGLPRSGTTYLHNLLIHFLDRDGLEFWELSEPIPWFNNNCFDIRFRKMRTFLLFLAYRVFIPNLQRMHPVSLSSYEECWHLFKVSLGVYNLDFQFGMNNFGNWISSNTINQSYHEYKMMLKIISSSNKKKNLVLKCPEHILFYNQLINNFKDCKIIWIHRDPVKVISSYSSMIYEIQNFFLKSCTKKEVGEFVTNRFYDMIKKGLQNRDTNNIKVTDINYLDLKNNPEDLIEIISKDIKIEIKNKNSFQTIKNLKKLKSKKSYSPEEFSINKDKVYQKFNNYIKRFDIKSEF